jgi:hypothetical protein
MKKIILLLIISISITNLIAEDTENYNPLYLNFSFGNFGPNHQFLDESATYQEIQLKYFPHYLPHSQVGFGIGAIFNHQNGDWSYNREFVNSSEFSSKLLYFMFEHDSNYEYFGFNIGVLYLIREHGNHDASGGDHYVKPSIGIKLGYISKAFVFLELTNDLIYTPYFKLNTLIMGVSVAINETVKSISVGYFESDPIKGIDLKFTLSISNKFLVHGQSVYRPSTEVYSFRLGVGFKI